MNLNELGFFQFDNLVQNRVPFLLVNLGVDLSGVFNQVSLMHLENNTLNTTAEKAIADIGEKKLPPHFAVVSICKDGSVSEKIANTLDQQGVMNSYYVRGGLIGFLKDRNDEK